MHTPFKLSADDDLVLTTEAGAVIDSLSLKGGVGRVFARAGRAGQLGRDAPEPRLSEHGRGRRGLPRHADGGTWERASACSSTSLWRPTRPRCSGPDGSYCDWIELYNTTGNDIDLSGYGVSDNPAQPLKYVLPDGTDDPRLLHAADLLHRAQGHLEHGDRGAVRARGV